MPTSSPRDSDSAKPTLHARTKREPKAAQPKPDVQIRPDDNNKPGGLSVEPVITRTALMVRPFDTETRDRMVAKAAYYRAEQRGFASGHEVEDWLASEAEVDEHLYRLYGEGRSF